MILKKIIYKIGKPLARLTGRKIKECAKLQKSEIKEKISLLTLRN